MESLIRQTAAIISNGEPVDSPEVLGRAMQQVLLRAADRWGLFRRFSWAPEMDHVYGHTYYMVFLCDPEAADTGLKTAAGYLTEEMAAFGLKNVLKVHPKGLEAEIPGSDARLFVFVYPKTFRLKKTVSYRQVPLAYEYYSITGLSDSARTEIMDALNSIKNSGKDPSDRKEETKTAKTGRKKKKAPDENFQLSLFDF